MKNKNVIRILGAVVDTRQLTLYKEDGEVLIFMQGDPRLRKIVDEITSQLVRQNWAEVEIPQTEDNTFVDFEKVSSTIKFFRVAKAALKKIFSKEDTEPVEAMAVGQVPTAVMPNVIPPSLVSAAAEAIEQFGEDELERYRDEQNAKKDPSAETKMKDAVAEIMKHAVPVSSADYHERTVAEQGELVDSTGKTDNQRTDGSHEQIVSAKPDTIVAMVGNKIVPGMERIKTQFSRATKLGSTAGIEKFLERLAAVIDSCSHSVEDLLKFMERGDLPIADDGSILIYKVLTRRGSRESGKYVDCHSKNVEQFTGAYVCMDKSLVDPNRRNECSNGLHIARRGYITNFPGDVCVLCKLAPEDVIAVPEYDANKMRVCGYHILMELTDKQFSLLRSNKPITDDEEGKRLLANAIAGKHIRRTHEVKITGQMGAGVITTKLTLEESPKPAPTQEAPRTAEALDSPSEMMKDEPTDPKAVVKQVEAEVKEVLTGRKAEAKRLYDALAGGGQKALDEIHAFKKASKVSWEKLGLSEINGPVISLREDKPGKIDRKKEPNRASERKAEKKSKAKAKSKKPDTDFWDADEDITADQRSNEHPADRSDTRVVNDVDLGEGSPKERIQKLLAFGNTSAGVAKAIWKIKQKSKKSLYAFGLTPEQVEHIMKLKDN